MKKITLLMYLIFLMNCPVLHSQTDLQEVTGNKRIGISLSMIYPDKIGRFGAGAETVFIHDLQKNFFYSISLGYGMAYYEDLEGRQFTYAVTTSNLEHYAHYMLTGCIGYNFLNSEKHRAGFSVGLAGRYSTKLYVKYAFHSLLPNDYPNDFFIPEMVEGYCLGVLPTISYTYNVSEKFSIQVETKCVIVTKFDNLVLINAGVFYRF
jgi:hypothetical protein